MFKKLKTAGPIVRPAKTPIRKIFKYKSSIFHLKFHSESEEDDEDELEEDSNSVGE